MIRRNLILDLNEKLIVDNFAGGGGASTGIEMALGRHVDIAVNHDKVAVALHEANHPQTRHYCEDVFKINPEQVTAGRPVGLAWFSPDCKHFSKAKGGKPRSKKIRGLAWVVVKWAARVKPEVIILENVEEFQKWGPLLEDGSPCPKRSGNTFRNFKRRLENLGYTVDHRELRACDYGTPTIRRRLFLIARCDGQPIIWPQPTHGDPSKPGFKTSGLLPWKTAADCIDWSVPCYSIFLTKEEARQYGIKRPLAEATNRRLARGIYKFVIDALEPYLVNFTHQGSERNESLREPFKTITGANRGEKGLCVPLVTEHANAGSPRSWSANEPLRTQCAEVKGGHFALVQAFLAKHYTGVTGSDLKDPIGTITSVDHHSLVAAHVSREFGQSIGSDAQKPLGTIMPGGAGKTTLVASHLTKLYGTTTGQKMDEALHTITGGGQHLGLVQAFLMKYYGEGGQDQSLKDPLHTVPTKDRFGLVTIHGVVHAITDICIRMLIARELYRGQGFPEDYIIDIMIDVIRHGKKRRVPLTNSAKVKMCGNSVCPQLAEALCIANVPHLAVWRNGERKQFQTRLGKLRPTCHA